MNVPPSKSSVFNDLFLAFEIKFLDSIEISLSEILFTFLITGVTRPSLTATAIQIFTSS